MRKLSNDELNRMDVEAMKHSEKHPVCVVLDNVRSMNNVGSVFRTADAFRIDTLFLCGITATPPHREIHKTALGATDSVSWRYCDRTEEALRQLREDGWRVVAVEQADHSTMLQDFKPDPAGRTAFIFGNEIHGVCDACLKMADDVVEIPQFGTKHSVNIAVSAGIILWHTFLQLRLFE
jgi:tRNA G18 (ribose-2'-O)-methylase SpoU